MCRLGRMGSGHFPVILTILMVITLALTYTLAVYNRDVNPFFPYISAAGARQPESCVFGELLTFAAFLSAVIIYLRYRLVKELNRGADLMLYRINIVACALGMASTFGLTIVGNFQETAVLSVHLVGAFMCFGFGCLYALLHTIISYRMHPLYNGIFIAHVRALFASVCVLGFFIATCAGVIADRDYRAAYHHPPPNLWYKKGDPGYTWHVVSAISEWVLAGAFSLFLLSYSRDFEKLRLGVSVEPLVQHLDETPVFHHRSPSPSTLISHHTPSPV